VHESGIPTIAELSNNPMLAKEHLESARAKMNDSLRKGLSTEKVFAANEPRLLAPCGVLFGLGLHYLDPFLNIWIHPQAFWPPKKFNSILCLLVIAKFDRSP